MPHRARRAVIEGLAELRAKGAGWQNACVTHPALLDELWREQSVWSQTANRMKQGIDRARLSALVIVVLVAVAGTAAAGLADVDQFWSRVLAGAAAFGSGVLPLLRPRWSGQKLKDWTRTRSVSEALKSDVYMWLAGVGRYKNDDTAAVLRRRTERLRDDASDLLVHRGRIQPVQRGLPAVHDGPSFFGVRVNDQINKYYVPKARAIQSRIKAFRLIEIVLGIAGVLLGAVAVIVGASFAAWIAVLATVGTAMSVHVSATRYEFQLIEFTRTAERLKELASRAREADVSDEELSRLAVKAERVISVENQGWMAKLAEDPPQQAASKTEAAASGDGD